MLLKEIGTGRTVEAAIADGAKKLGVDPSRTQYEIIEAPKKGFLGFGEAPAKVYVFIEVGSEQTAVDYVKQVLGDMELNAEVEISRELNSEGGKILKIKGEEAGALIGSSKTQYRRPELFSTLFSFNDPCITLAAESTVFQVHPAKQPEPQSSRGIDKMFYFVFFKVSHNQICHNFSNSCTVRRRNSSARHLLM